jgi:hypothetical protein
MRLKVKNQIVLIQLDYNKKKKHNKNTKNPLYTSQRNFISKGNLVFLLCFKNLKVKKNP